MSRLASLVNITNEQKLKKNRCPGLKVKETTYWSCVGFFGMQPFYTFSVGVRHHLLLCECVLATCGDSLMENRWAIPCKPSENKQMTVRCSIPTISRHTTVFPLATPKQFPNCCSFSSLSIIISSALMPFSSPLIPLPPLLLVVSCHF